MDKQNLKEEILTLRKFKRSLFELYWEKFGTFYLHALPHPQLVIGKRGLVGDEREVGIVLVFGSKGGSEKLGPCRRMDLRRTSVWLYLGRGFYSLGLYITLF